MVLETSETILAKYRTKVTEKPLENGVVKTAKDCDETLVDVGHIQIDSHSVFADAKKKLRHVFSSSSVLYILPKQVGVCKRQLVGVQKDFFFVER